MFKVLRSQLTCFVRSRKPLQGLGTDPTSSVTRPIASSACCQSQSKYLRYNRDSVRQQDPSFDDSNIAKAPQVQPFGTSWFPTLDTHNQSFEGVRFLDLPIIHIKATRNNTVITANDGQTGETLVLQSAGTVGFRNARKGTNVAAQAAAVSLAGDCLRKNIKTVRVCLRGLGPGRQPALKSLQMTGLNIVSITDTTRLAHSGNRPKKARRL